MLRHGQERNPSEQGSSRSQSLSSRLTENEGGEERSHVFKGPDEEKKFSFDIAELKKITVKILRKTPQNSVPTLQRSIVNPATVTPVRRPDEGKRPLFERKELASGVKEESVAEKKEKSPPVEKSKRRSRSRSSSRSRSERRRRSNSVEPSSSRRRDRDRSRSPHSDYDRRKGSRRHSRSGGKYEKRHSSSSSERRSKGRSRSPDRSRRGRSYSRSPSRYRSRSRSYERRRHSRSRSRSRDRRRRSHSHDRNYVDPRYARFVEEREYLKALRRKQKEEDDKRLKDEAMRRKEKSEAERKQLTPKEDEVDKDGKVLDPKPSTSKDLVKEGGGRGRPPRMRPPQMFGYRPPMMPMVPFFPAPYPPIFRRPPPFMPYPPYPHNPRGFRPPQY